MTKLYIGNLSPNATEKNIRALFTTHGVVERVALITDLDTGQSRGFGFIEMANADAPRAIEALDGKDFEGCPLLVVEAWVRPSRSDGVPRRH